MLAPGLGNSSIIVSNKGFSVTFSNCNQGACLSSMRSGRVRSAKPKDGEFRGICSQPEPPPPAPPGSLGVDSLGCLSWLWSSWEELRVVGIEGDSVSETAQLRSCEESVLLSRQRATSGGHLCLGGLAQGSCRLLVKRVAVGFGTISRIDCRGLLLSDGPVWCLPLRSRQLWSCTSGGE